MEGKTAAEYESCKFEVNKTAEKVVNTLEEVAFVRNLKKI